MLHLLVDADSFIIQILTLVRMIKREVSNVLKNVKMRG